MKLLLIDWFIVQVYNAQRANYAAAIVFNNESNQLIPMGGDGTRKYTCIVQFTHTQRFVQFLNLIWKIYELYVYAGNTRGNIACSFQTN